MRLKYLRRNVTIARFVGSTNMHADSLAKIVLSGKFVYAILYVGAKLYRFGIDAFKGDAIIISKRTPTWIIGSSAKAFSKPFKAPAYDNIRIEILTAVYFVKLLGIMIFPNPSFGSEIVFG